jgi:hypothetical protein
LYLSGDALDHLGYSDHDFIALFFNLYVNRTIPERYFMHTELPGCNNSLDFCHIRAGHPPEIIINKNNGCHETFSSFAADLPQASHRLTTFYGRVYQSCASEWFFRYLTLFFLPGS